MRESFNIHAVLFLLCCVLLTPAQIYDTLYAIPDSNVVKPLSIKALEEYPILVVENNYQNLGFDSLEQVKYCTLGLPVRLYTIWVKSLFTYQRNVIVPRNIMDKGLRVLYPVTYNTMARSGIICSKTKNGWKTVMHGAAPLARAVTEMRESVALSQNVDEKLLSAVEIPAMCVFFVAHALYDTTYTDWILHFTPITDYAEFNLVGGNTLTADSILKIVADYIRSDTTRYRFPGP